jgi:hypothetical protein
MAAQAAVRARNASKRLQEKEEFSNVQDRED